MSGAELTLTIGRYVDGNALAVQVYGPDADTGAPKLISELSLHRPRARRLGPDEVIIMNWRENVPLLAPVLATGLFEDTGKCMPARRVQPPIWRVVNPAHLP